MKKPSLAALSQLGLLAALCCTCKAQTIITFDEFPPRTLVSELYAPQGVHFLSDFRPDLEYRNSPIIVTNANAHSPPNILLNGYADFEIFNSAGVPLVFWFDNPMRTVSMYVGTTSEPCGAPNVATISFRDCNGALRGQVVTNFTQVFNTFVTYTDPQNLIQRVDVDYGSAFCPEAIDQLSFSRGPLSCTNSIAPEIFVTYPDNDQLVISSLQQVQGYVVEPGILRYLYINGVSTTFHLEADGYYHFDTSVYLQEGNNTITLVAENSSGVRGTAQLRLFLGTPVSATLTSFHLTQRGVMLDQPCDVDTPLVAGKAAMVRVSMDVRTSGGLPTYASSIKMNVWRKTAGADQLVGSAYGNTYAPYTSQFNTPTDLSAIHFWVPGYLKLFDVAGDYRLSFEAYVGSTLIGSPSYACGGQYFTFSETKPIRLLILPVERGRNDPLLNGTTHVEKFYRQLDSIARAYPVRDGVGQYRSDGARRSVL